jgi:hypothetical protein
MLDVLYWNSACNFLCPRVSELGRQMNIIQKAWEMITIQVHEKCIIAGAFDT